MQSEMSGGFDEVRSAKDRRRLPGKVPDEADIFDAGGPPAWPARLREEYGGNNYSGLFPPLTPTERMRFAVSLERLKPETARPAYPDSARGKYARDSTTNS
jgi:hypothetical protein